MLIIISRFLFYMGLNLTYLKLNTTVSHDLVPGCERIPALTYTCHRYSKQREWDSWAHKPGLTHLSLVCSPGPSVVLCVHYQ